MLNLLIENFDKHFVTPADKALVDQCLAREFQLLTDVQHLETRVIDKPLFDWDFTVLHDGFLRLVEPFMKKQSGIPYLFLHAIRDLDAFKPDYTQAVILLEYSYYASLINDYYTFHPLFTVPEPNLRQCSQLTQVRYVGQYLQMYPRYLLVRNVFGVDDPTLFNLHRLLTQISIAAGTSRGVLLKWAQAGFRGMSVETYLQNSINALSHYILFPVLLACVCAGAHTQVMRAVRKAFSLFSLVAKLRFEKKMLQDTPRIDCGEFESYGILPIRIEGYVFAKRGLSLDGAQDSETRNPDVLALCEQIGRSVRRDATASVIEDIERAAASYFDEFRREIDAIGRLNKTCRLLGQCVGL